MDARSHQFCDRFNVMIEDRARVAQLLYAMEQARTSREWTEASIRVAELISGCVEVTEDELKPEKAKRVTKSAKHTGSHQG